MFRLILTFLLLILATNVTFPENPKEFFKRLMQSAHPLPEYDIKELPAIPFSEPSGKGFFLNIPTTVDEVGQYQMQNESSIAVNPKNPKILIASAVDYRDTSATWVYFSTDGGRNWKNKKLGRPYPNWRSSNDPSVAFSYDGVGYLVYGGFGNLSDTGVLYGENGVFLARTFDDCKTWEAHIPVIVHRGPQTLDSVFEDKYYICVDNSPNSPYKGSLYIPWKRVVPRDSSTQIVISKSTDKGTTWSVPIPVSLRKPGSSEDTTFGQSFPIATVGPNGEVFLFWNDGIEKGIGFAKSLDGGNSFTEPKIIIKYNPFGKAKLITNQGYRHTVKNKVRAEAYPSVACDVTGGERNGYLYLCWSADSIPNVYFSRSTDGGESWSTPKVVHSDLKNDQFWHWLAIDPTNGDLAIMFLDSRRDPENLLVECWVSFSSDGGENWIDKPVSDVAIDLRLNPFTDNSFAGDYSGCAFFSGKIYPSWVDMRNSVKNIFDSDVYTAYININTPNPPQNFVAKTIPNEPTTIQLNWEPPTSKVFGHPFNSMELSYVLRRNEVFVASFPFSFYSFKDTGLIPYQNYRYSLCSVLGSDTSVEVFSNAFAGGAKDLRPPSIVSKVVEDGNTNQICVDIPRLRADSITPIVNMAKLLVYDVDTLLYEVPLNSDDTGKVVCVNFLTKGEGFYRIRTRVADKDGNRSDFSNEIIAFRGKVVDISVENYIDEFDVASSKKYLRYNGWGYSTNFFVSPPSSITDSPQGNYPTRTVLTIGTFPFKFSGDGYIVLSFDNAAIIHRSDSGLVEIVNAENESIVLERYNMERFAPWQDKILDQNDWKKESIILDAKEITKVLGNDFLYIQFRLYSGTIGVDDGWYIDNLEIRKSATMVEHFGLEGDIEIFPNPTEKYLNFKSTKTYDRFNLQDIYGNLIDIEPIHRFSNEALFDVSSLPSGVYFLSVGANNEGYRRILPFVVKK